ADEVVTVPGRLDEVGGDDDVLVFVEQGLAHVQATLQAGDGGGQQQFGVDVELGAELGLPLVGQGRRTQHGQAGGVPLGQEFGGDQARFDGLADTDVVTDEHAYGRLAQCHEQWHQLVGAGLDGDAGQGTEGARPGAETDAQGRSQQTGGLGVAQVGGVGGVEGGRADLFQGGKEGGHVVVAAAQGAQHQHVGGALGEHHPFSAPGRDQGAGCVRGGHGVGVLTSSRGKSVQVVGGVPGRRWFEADLRGLYFGDLVPVVVFDAEVDHGYKITGSGAAAGAEDVLVTAHGGGPVLVVGDTYDLPAGVLQPLFRLDVALGHVGVLVHGSVDKHRDL